MAQILVVDDEIGIRELLSEILSDEGHTVRVAENATRAREARIRARPDLVLLDIWMPDADGITLLKEWASNGQLTMPVVMMSGHATIDTAVEATRIGALDFLEKPIALQKLLATVKRALAQQEGRNSKVLSIVGLGKSASLIEFKKRVSHAANIGRSTILLRGEPGAMAEVYARAMHQQGMPWISATAVSAQSTQELNLQVAGGILFIDDLAHLSANQLKHVSFVASHIDRSKVRVVSFSTESPRRLIDERNYDPTLVSRLSEVVLTIPPVREHLEDVPDIASLMLAQLVDSRFCPPRRFAGAALAAMQAFTWPGNLEDVAAAVRTLASTAGAEEINADEVAEVLHQFSTENVRPQQSLILDGPLREAREAFERAYFERLLDQEGGAIARVAEKSGLERTHLYRKLKSLGIPTNRKDGAS